MFASELNRSAPRVHARGSYRFATVKSNRKESELDENTEDGGAYLRTIVKTTIKNSPALIARARTTPILPPRPDADVPVGEQAAGQRPGFPDRAADHPSSRGIRRR